MLKLKVNIIVSYVHILHLSVKVLKVTFCLQAKDLLKYPTFFPMGTNMVSNN